MILSRPIVFLVQIEKYHVEIHKMGNSFTEAWDVKQQGTQENG